MKAIEGVEMKNPGFKIWKIGDLIYHEGPFLSHFAGDDNREYFMKWVDKNDALHRWMLFSVTDNNLSDFFNKKISLKDLIKLNPNGIVFFFDFGGDFQIRKTVISDLDSIPTEYYPSNDSFYDEDSYEEYAKELKERSVPHSKVAVDSHASNKEKELKAQISTAFGQRSEISKKLKKISFVDYYNSNLELLIDKLLILMTIYESSNKYSETKLPVYRRIAIRFIEQLEKDKRYTTRKNEELEDLKAKHFSKVWDTNFNESISRSKGWVILHYLNKAKVSIERGDDLSESIQKLKDLYEV